MMNNLKDAARIQYMHPIAPFELRFGPLSVATVWFDTQQMGWRAEVVDNPRCLASIGISPDDAVTQLELEEHRMSVTHGLNLRFGSWEARYKMAHDDEQSRPSPYDYSVSASRRCRVKECGPRRYVATLRMGPHVFYGFGPVPDVAVTDLLDRMLTNDPIYMVDLDGVGEIPPAWAATMAPQFVIPQEKVH